MKILAVDTALGACSAAVLSGEAVLATRHVAMERGHAEALAPMVEDMMREAGLAFATLERLGVTTGPGTFTGQRVGLAFMRGLRVALGIPLVGVTSLAAMAHQAIGEAGGELGAAIHDARRDEVYFEVLSRNAVLAPASVARFDDAAAVIAKLAKGVRLAVAGTAAPRFKDYARARGFDVADSQIAAPDAIWVARLGAIARAPDGPPKPLYLRAPDARLPGGTR